MDIPANVKQELERILSKFVDELKAEEAAFLRARAAYLNPEQRNRFASVLGEQPTQPQPQAQEQPQPAQAEPQPTQEEKKTTATAPNLPPAGTQYADVESTEIVPDEEAVAAAVNGETEDHSEVVTEDASGAQPSVTNPVQPAEVTNGMTDEENPYSDANADPDNQ